MSWQAACESHDPQWFGTKREDFTDAQADADDHNSRNSGHAAGPIPAD